MGLIDRVIGGSAAATALGNAAVGVAEVFTANATKQMEASQAAYIAALDEHGTEFQYLRPGRFDRFVNGLNRMPRPMLALGTLSLFIYAMADPVGFAERMVGLAYVPEPLWWLLGAIVSFYFGAREAYYFRNRAAPVSPPLQQDENLALREWRGAGSS
ncbi:MAG: holin family protein [Phaeovulum sp.]|uniref:holin family protein n=1 Tax=Phaeovulum sp. TaxID=2934796 RepID=UPI00272FC6CF|nr:holin family protein [Phaeovulum sp.]MDP2064060.1 holin family protein [Phaeovulum sp.]